MRILILLLSLTIASVSSAKIFTWKDSSGRTIYGDNPPENNTAKEVNPPELTIIPGYKDPTYSTPTETPPQVQKSSQVVEYTSFKITSPTAEQSIQANNGNINIAMQLSPALAKQDRIFIYLDGKKIVKDSQSLNAALSNLDRGSHSVFAVIRTKNGDVLINSNTVKFYLLRSSRIGNRNIHR